jgi:anthranilate phosphoribosyltransferase
MITYEQHPTNPNVVILKVNEYYDAQKEIDNLRQGIRGALAALQTGAAIDVVAAIQILRGLK